MEVITIESQAFKQLMAKINTITRLVASIESKTEEPPEDIWVDSYEVCTFLKISNKTLQRLRASNEIAYSRVRGKVFYQIGEIRRLLDQKIIRRSEEHLEDLIKNHRLYVEQRQAIREDK